MADPLKHNANLVESLGSALRSGQHGLGSVPLLLDRVLTGECWREFVTQLGAHVTYDRFEEFVTTPPVRGLGSDMALVRRIVSDDPRLLDLLDRALQRPAGGDRRSEDAINGNNVPVDSGRPEGNGRAKALRRLRKDRPDLHERVIAGELSPHRAAVEAGFRHRTITVPVDDAERLAATLRRHLDRENLARVRDLLADQEATADGH